MQGQPDRVIISTTTTANTETDAILAPQQQPQKQHHHVVALIVIGQAADNDFKYDYDHHAAASAHHFEALHSAMDYFHQRRRITNVEHVKIL